MSHEPLRRARQEQGISLRRMAELLDEDRGNLSRAERGDASAHTIERIASRYEMALNLEPRSLVRECGTLPANLLALVLSAIPRYLNRLTYLIAPTQAAA